MWAHSLRIRGPRQSIPIALVGSKETSDSNTSEVEIEMSERVEDNVGRESRGGNSKELSVKMEYKYLLKSEALSKSEVAKAEHNSTDGGMELWPEIPLMYFKILLQLELANLKMRSVSYLDFAELISASSLLSKRSSLLKLWAVG